MRWEKWKYEEKDICNGRIFLQNSINVTVVWLETVLVMGYGGYDN